MIFLEKERYLMYSLIMKSEPLSTLIDGSIKRALVRFCKKKGLKIRHVIEEAIAERLEDELDLAAYRARKNEEVVSLEAVLKKLK